MTAFELEIKEFIKDIDSEETLNKLKQYLKKLKKRSLPCQYTEEELKLRINQGIEDAKNGLGCTQEDMRKKYSSV